MQQLRLRSMFWIMCGLCMVFFASPIWAGYVNNGNGTVTDTSTGLMWQQDTPDDTMIWEQALSYCENSTLAGYTDWRLPTIKELRRLVDYSRFNPAINTTYFPDTVSSFYWSSTTWENETNFTLLVIFDYGYDGLSIKLNNSYVRAVRGGQSGSLGDSVISVSPTNRDVAKDAGTTTFSVSNTGTGTMPWTAAVTSGGSWLSITSGDSGSNSGTINCSFNASTGTSTRTGTIRVTADGATGSPVDVTVTQAATPTPLTITASAGTGGTISPSGEVSVAYGGDQTFTIAHDAGYIVSSFSIDGSPITFPASDVDYTFPNVTTNHTISVSFTEGVSPLGYFGKIYQDPLEVLPGATVLQSGKGFTRNSPVTLRVRDSIGQEHNFFYLTTDDNGDFTRLRMHYIIT